MLEEIVSRIGTATAISSAVAIGMNRDEPRYLLGAAVGIPSAVLLGGIVPGDLSVPIGVGYLGGLMAYGITTWAEHNPESVTRFTTIAGLVAAGTTALIRYV